MGIVIAGRYELMGPAPLGRGHFGEVWKARDHVQAQDVALKLFLPGTLPTHLRQARAYQEARFLTELRGPRILPVENAGTDPVQDVPFIAMQIAKAGSTEDAISRRPYGTWPYQAVQWLSQMLVGLESCHAAGVLHGDVKPGNILLQREDSALLGDLGVGQRMDSNGRAAVAGDLLVVPHDSITGGEIDRRADTYGAGVSLFRLLSGRWPYWGDSEAELRAAITSRRPSSLRELSPHIPLALVRIVERATNVDAAERYGTAQEMRIAIGRLSGFSRAWLRISPHPLHVACWQETAPHAAHGVCVIQTAGRYDIGVWRGGRKRHRLYQQRLRGSALPTTLRHIFRAVGM